ncbi:hypothetical protein H9623_06560 [Oerskovia sp. Sa1BUA8]|uniref:Uncharacterized protein n=1 Tax=Oerskovia douganii TaxID=2762210 RepID=A0A9D5YZE9_9CELL|nr:hypothetical protein [Oerskovia douganii]MBE7699969.1 hypothetical protein [Oerskovia douganii]
METSSELQAIANASDSDLMLICAAVAERGVAFCQVLVAGHLAWVDSSLELAWAAAAGEPVQDECFEALDELEMEPQDGEDDSSRPEFHVTQAVGLVGNALAVSLRPSVSKAEMSINTLRSLLSMVDFKLSGEVPVIVRRGEGPPPPGQLVHMEIDAELAVLALLSRGAESSTQGRARRLVANRARDSARVFAEQLVPSIEVFAKLGGWEL